MLRRTALFEEHCKLNGRMVDFGGWELPVQYTGIVDEHLACRSSAGLFDVSHMGEVEVSGDSAENFLNFLVTNDVRRLKPGQALYTVMCHSSGGIVDDLVIYRRAQNLFLVVVNAANTEKDFKHMKTVQSQWMHGDTANKDLSLKDVSATFTQIAIQGRNASAILQKITKLPLDEIETYAFAEGTILDRIPTIIARTGYTGEDGFEIYLPWNEGPKTWQALIELGKPYQLKPCGLGARDTLRLEVKYPLYGNELTDETHPLEAGLGWVVKLDKGDFMGRDALLQIQKKGLARKLVGIKLHGKAIPRHDYVVFDSEGTSPIGAVTSGTQSPSLKEPIAIAYTAINHSKVGTKLTIDVRGTKIPGEVVAAPFYKRPY